MNTQNATLALIIQYGLTVRQIPYEVVTYYTYRDGSPIPKGYVIVVRDGRQYLKNVKVPINAGKWMAKTYKSTSTNVTWDIKTDHLSDTLEEAVEKAVQDALADLAAQAKVVEYEQ